MRAPTLLFALSLALCPAVSFAQGDVSEANAAEAKKQFAIGTKAFSAGHFPEAAQAFEAAAAARPNAVALYTAALAWEQAPQSERAADDYGRALDMTGGGLNPQQTNTARERVTALEKTLGTLAVTGPDGYKVQLDQFTEAPVPVRLHGTPGTHALSVRAPGKTPEKREVLLEGGQTQNMDVTPVPVKKVEQAPPPPPPKEVVVEKPVHELSLMKALGFSAIGVGGAATLTAILLGISALDAGDAYNAAPTHASLVHANALATWTTVSWIAAGVFIAGGVTLVLIPAPSSAAATKEKEKEKEKSSDEARLSIVPTLGGAMLQGAF
jgi:tetratricopeptide (TPR) repeat protein